MCIRYYKIGKEIVFKAELVFHFLSPLPPLDVAFCPQGGQELSLLKIRNQSPVVLGIRGEIQRGRLTCLPKEISKPTLPLPPGPAHTNHLYFEKKHFAPKNR